MIRIHEEAITKLAGVNLYDEIEATENQRKGFSIEAMNKNNTIDALQAQVSELKATESYTQDRLKQRLAECHESTLVIDKLEAAYALLKNAIDKKAVLQTAKGFAQGVKAAYAEAEKVMGAK